MRLFCFPFAGGGASLYRNWWRFLSDRIEVCCVQPPGREERIQEAPYDGLSKLSDALLDALAPYLHMPFAFFGHSLGGLLSFECARRLRRLHGLAPEHLFISACRAPHLPLARNPIHRLPDKEFIEGLRQLNGTPEAALNNAELMSLMQPLLRADFAVYETYSYEGEPPFNTAISVFGGLEDGEVSKDDIAAWREQTHGAFDLRMFPGDHFYIHSAYPDVLRYVAQELDVLLTNHRRSRTSGTQAG